jgi:predicted AAA+ superfamily ATPase
VANLLARPGLTGRITAALRRSSVVALLGPRQCGKTTLARGIAAERPGLYLDLESPLDLARLDNPLTLLGAPRGLIVIDEVQHRPDLFSVLRVLADRRPLPARFLILGSASPELLRQGSETLAGRLAFVEMGGFGLEEVGTERSSRLWLRGGLPRSFLARSDRESLSWREDFIRTFLERDIRSLGFSIPAQALRRLWLMLAHYHGQILNASEIARSLGEGHTTVRRHLDLLCGALVMRQLQPWFENIGKRQIKAPKVYVRDSGLLHALLGTPDLAALRAHPKGGASWEGFAIEQILALVGERNAFFWATQSGAELDLLLMVGGKRIGIEVKFADAPRATKSMAVARQDLKLDRLYAVYPGDARYSLGEHAEAMGLSEALTEVERTAGRR